MVLWAEITEVYSRFGGQVRKSSPGSRKGRMYGKKWRTRISQTNNDEGDSFWSEVQMSSFILDNSGKTDVATGWWEWWSGMRRWGHRMQGQGPVVYFFFCFLFKFKLRKFNSPFLPLSLSCCVHSWNSCFYLSWVVTWDMHRTGLPLDYTASGILGRLKLLEAWEFYAS